MLSANHIVTMDKTTDLISSLFYIISSQDMAKRLQSLYYGTTFAYLCIPVLFFTGQVSDHLH